MSTLPTGGGMASPEDLAAARQAEAERSTSLMRVREAATKWQAGLAGLLAIVTGLSVTSVADTVSALDEPFGTIFAVGILAAFAIGVWATFTALRASGGMPRITRSARPPVTHQSAVDALVDLRRAINITIAALAVFGAVAVIAWFGPRSSPAPTIGEVRTGSRTVCGQIDKTSAPGYLFVSTESDVEVYALTDVAGWKGVSRCP